MASAEKRLHAVIRGRVQGVGFRYFVQENAYRLNVKGWVRNRWDGTVELEGEGKQRDLEQLLKVLHRGPTSSIVSEIETEWLPAAGEFIDFRVRKTSD